MTVLLQLLQIFMAMMHNKEGQLQMLKPFLHFYNIAYRRTFGTTILGIAGQSVVTISCNFGLLIN